MKHDRVSRFLFDNTDIRGEIVCLNESYAEAHAHQDFDKALAPIFGEFLAGSALLAEVLKFEGTLTLQAKGDGPVAIIMAEATDSGDVRGIVRMQPEGDFGNIRDHNITLKSLIGNGILTITIDPKKGNRYQGIVPISGEHLADCLRDYFAQSEQLPTHIQLFANDTFCGGLFLQCLPAAKETDLERRDDAWETSQQLASTLTEDELFSLSNEDVLVRLFHEMQCRVFTPKAVRFHCTCTRKRSANALQSLGADDARALLGERQVIKIDCQFCGKEYSFGEQDLNEIFPPGPQALH